MKLTITHLKAPWPLGAVVGDVVELPSVPSWAAGKCVPAAEDAEVTVFAASPATEPESSIVTNIEPIGGQDVVTGDGSGEAVPEAPAAEQKAGKRK